MIEELSTRIWENADFKSDLRKLKSAYSQQSLGISSDVFEDEKRALKKLTSSAVILSASPVSEHRETAYEIATSASVLCSGLFPGVTHALLLVLNRLGNFPAIEFAQEKFSIHTSALPTKTYSETSFREEENTVHSGERSVTLTDFQFTLWNGLKSEKTVSISAPTSAGKSFAIQLFAEHSYKNDLVKHAAIVVPSRALITQVSSDISKWPSYKEGVVEIVTTPIPSDSQIPPKTIFVVTQERLQLLLSSHHDLKLDLLLVDEAQNLSDGPRGVLLTSVVDNCLRRNPDTKLVLAGPNLANPETLSQSFDREPKVVQTSTPTVSQNVFFVNTSIENEKEISISLKTGEDNLPLGSLELEQPLFDHQSKLTNIPLAIGNEGQSLIYALGPSECEKIAFGLADTEAGEDHLHRSELSKLAKETVHPKFQLANSVLKGVGYHYGRLPTLLRKAIEDAFSDGHLDYLVTTSTLLQGVNLPARNLFLHNPQKGQNKPISSVDFWNLAGRAGRLGKEFSGNIFLVDYESWESDPMSGDKLREVTPSFDDHLKNQTSQLVDYISDPDVRPKFDEQDLFENTFSKLVQDHLSGNLESTLTRSGLPPESIERKNLEISLEKAIQSVELDEETINNCPTVTIHRQNALLQRLKDGIRRKGPDYVIPKHPKSKGAYQSYLIAMIRCHQEVLKLPKKDKSHKYFTPLILKWMNGDPIPKIIDANYDYKKKEGKQPNLSTVIRSTLSEIENDVRFKYVRLFSCYNAVLELALKSTGHERHIQKIPSIPLYLEMGASSTSMMSMMGLGLSRFTSARLQSLARRQDMSIEEVRTWLFRQDLESLDIPVASQGEIRKTFNF